MRRSPARALSEEVDQLPGDAAEAEEEEEEARLSGSKCAAAAAAFLSLISGEGDVAFLPAVCVAADVDWRRATAVAESPSHRFTFLASLSLFPPHTRTPPFSAISAKVSHRVGEPASPFVRPSLCRLPARGCMPQVEKLNHRLLRRSF